jgi:hypothetical protein
MYWDPIPIHRYTNQGITSFKNTRGCFPIKVYYEMCNFMIDSELQVLEQFNATITERTLSCSSCTDSTLKKYAYYYQPRWRVGECTFLLLSHIQTHSFANNEVVMDYNESKFIISYTVVLWVYYGWWY